jgi:hypothetical protein
MTEMFRFEGYRGEIEHYVVVSYLSDCKRFRKSKGRQPTCCPEQRVRRLLLRLSAFLPSDLKSQGESGSFGNKTPENWPRPRVSASPCHCKVTPPWNSVRCNYSARKPCRTSGLPSPVGSRLHRPACGGKPDHAFLRPYTSFADSLRMMSFCSPIRL